MLTGNEGNLHYQLYLMEISLLIEGFITYSRDFTLLLEILGGGFYLYCLRLLFDQRERNFDEKGTES